MSWSCCCEVGVVGVHSRCAKKERSQHSDGSDCLLQKSSTRPFLSSSFQ